ncbi:hypothetical protein JCM24511_01857 [Saitozyma sp. JCM 24511]|nr:hypothetical protein JCM24511_01857 [Saitozyma sp. JCM 24511]
MASTILPLELVDRCIGSSIWVLMKNEREFTGTLMGFDDYCRVLITLVMPGGVIEGPSLTRRSEVTPEGITETELGQTLLNGNNIAMSPWQIPFTPATSRLGVKGG